jgi:hypothetical protein
VYGLRIVEQRFPGRAYVVVRDKDHLHGGTRPSRERVAKTQEQNARDRLPSRGYEALLLVIFS